MTIAKRSSRLRIVVTGLVGRMPVGGMAWHYLQYVMGLARLGHDVYYHEDTWCWPFHPVENSEVETGDYSAGAIQHFFEQFAPELADHWHYLHLHSQSFGMDRVRFDEIARTADLFINVSGASFIPDDLSEHCVKIFIDTDPGYNQIMLSERHAWSEFVDRWFDIISAHDRYFTFAENIGAPDCLVPRLGWKWTPTRMPIILDTWQLGEPRPSAPWSTIMSWNVFKGKLVHNGREFGDKRQEFEKIINLPSRSPGNFRVAVGGQDAPVEELADRGWDVVAAPEISLTPEAYQAFIRESAGEISVAKNVYVAMNTGWFSERSACYLASGRPVVLQDTGFSEILPVGSGLLVFSNLDEAAAGIDAVAANYAAHSKAAREVARTCFDSDVVLAELLGNL
ncbi:MAG TPA: hypothetical protein VMO47_02970 [Rhodothermales bacterium]|nr:hypothetical protein [Rhodothermales bacterium]